MDSKIIDELATVFGVTMIVARIRGRRWSFTDNTTGAFPVSISKKIQLNQSWGIVVYNWDCLTAEKKLELECTLKNLDNWNE